jgi:hypothetical protein
MVYLGKKSCPFADILYNVPKHTQNSYAIWYVQIQQIQVCVTNIQQIYFFHVFCYLCQDIQKL